MEPYSTNQCSFRYDQSAIYYAQTRISFEEATLKFIEAKQEVALRTYLEKKLQTYTSNVSLLSAEHQNSFAWITEHKLWWINTLLVRSRATAVLKLFGSKILRKKTVLQMRFDQQ